MGHPLIENYTERGRLYPVFRQDRSKAHSGTILSGFDQKSWTFVQGGDWICWGRYKLVTGMKNCEVGWGQGCNVGLQGQTNLGCLLSVQLQWCWRSKWKAENLYNSTPYTQLGLGDTRMSTWWRPRDLKSRGREGASQKTKLYLFLPKYHTTFSPGLSDQP